MTVEQKIAISEIMIEADDLGKAYRLFANPGDRTKQLLLGHRRQYYQDFWALKGISFCLARGETLGIVGVNGAGKSTLLQLICGTLRRSAGKVSVFGRLAALLELGAGFNPQFTGRENVCLKAAALGLSKVEITERFEAIAAFAGIGEFMDLPVKVYSSGMYARLAFSVCAHVDADVLIIDEILSVGDAVFRQKCMRFLNRFREQGTVLFVSHDSGAVATLCERALWLDHGEMRELGPAAGVCANYLASLSERGARTEFLSKAADDRWWAPPPPPLMRDARHIDASRMKISEFDPAAPWHGHGGAVIEEVGFHSPDGTLLTEMRGEDEVVLRIRCRAERDISQPILGFVVRDRLGQNVFGDNTYIAYRDSPPSVTAGALFEGTFRFQLPCLATGSYSVAVAFVEGTQEDHTHLHWIEDALIVTVFESPVSRGIVGLPATDIRNELSVDNSQL